MTLVLCLLLLGALSGWWNERSLRKVWEQNYNDRETECQSWADRYWRLFLLYSEKRRAQPQTQEQNSSSPAVPPAKGPR